MSVVIVQSDTDPAPAPDPGRPQMTLLSVTALAKSFGATAALRRCSFDLRAGEVHAIVGENGSGKSTLVKILAGVHRPDSGEVRWGDRPGGRTRSPRAAHDAEIFTVFQEVLVVGSQSVLDNVWLGADSLMHRRAPIEDKRRRATQVLTELLDATPPLDAPAESLSLSERQACCVARALVRDPRVLILDESTSALDVATRDRLFAMVRRLCANGCGVIFISHRMDEIEDLADRVTVLRSGESVATLERGQAEHRGAGPSHDRRGPSHRGRGSGLAPPARRWRRRAARASAAAGPGRRPDRLRGALRGARGARRTGGPRSGRVSARAVRGRGGRSGGVWRRADRLP